ncbi:hypothetical protein SGRA_0087 [Saprospira grandis str. Lewin]|uniref:Uncharacterized protein n=1 Tax=Saprospira grandis (strain Lewin) TaxID=984262 RepID=H6L4F3_SAPGL|nr:hypothetical protein SGRA_0087 [Saprospira grandis str. Lewin]
MHSGRAIAQLAALLGPAALRALVCRLRRPCYSPSAASLRSPAAASPPARRKKNPCLFQNGSKLQKEEKRTNFAMICPFTKVYLLHIL